MSALLCLPDVMARTGLARATVYRDVKRGAFPKPIKTGSRSVAWVAAEVEQWIECKIRESRPELGATAVPH